MNSYRSRYAHVGDVADTRRCIAPSFSTTEAVTLSYTIARMRDDLAIYFFGMCLAEVKKPRDYTRFHEINTEIL